MTRFTRLTLAAAALATLMACASAPQAPSTVAIPVECRETVPDRPEMPTEALKARGCPSSQCADELLQASLAEIERREGYELKLRAGLVACTAPAGK